MGEEWVVAEQGGRCWEQPLEEKVGTAPVGGKNRAALSEFQHEAGSLLERTGHFCSQESASVPTKIVKEDIILRDC